MTYHCKYCKKELRRGVDNFLREPTYPPTDWGGFCYCIDCIDAKDADPENPRNEQRFRGFECKYCRAWKSPAHHRMEHCSAEDAKRLHLGTQEFFYCAGCWPAHAEAALAADRKARAEAEPSK